MTSEVENSIMSDTSDTVIENVLILQGGGSLGAFGCGVFKALANSNVKIDIIAGTSIGGLNASIIAGAKAEDHPEKALEQYWLELGEGSSANFMNSPFMEGLPGNQTLTLTPLPPPLTTTTPTTTDHSVMTHISQVKSIISFYTSTIYGDNKIFLPRWRPEFAFTDPEYFTPNKWTYLYDHSPLVKTAEKYIDYNKLQPNGKPNSRLIITAVNVMTAEPLIFDSTKQQITSKHILAATGYPSYYFPWVEVEKGVYAWDGSLLSNTPLREVIDASPVKDKRVFLVENYPKRCDALPDNLLEVQHRARDIMFSDKTIHNVKMSRAITYYLRLIDDLYKLLESQFNSEKKEDIKKFKKIRARYKKVSEQHGAEIKRVHYITRSEPFPSLYENADFSVDTIKASIKDGELKTNQILRDIKIR
ncbi:MAG: patatin-like phospholipase family protein [Thermoproteota archaeon]|nr:patatin-like phospholipase family protein [Thermoproteota archaeon]